MRLVLDVDGRRGKLWDVVRKPDSAHELGEPGPHRISIELAKQCGVMEPDPPTPTLLDIFREGSRSLWGPTIGRIVQLNEKLIARKECIVDWICALNVIDREVLGGCLLLQPHFCRIDKGLVNSSGLGQRNGPEFCTRGLRAARRYNQHKEERHNCQSSKSIKP